jgi:hypothetical protein
MWVHAQCALRALQILNMVGNKQATPQLPPHIPEGLANLLTCCFRQQPSARPSAAQLVTELKVRISKPPLCRYAKRVSLICLTSSTQRVCSTACLPKLLQAAALSTAISGHHLVTELNVITHHS